MRSPAAAIAWEFRRRHRWGLIALGAYFFVLAAIRLLFVPGQRVGFEDAQSFALAVVVPLTSTVLYFLAVFSFGLSGDLGARQSMYPARMFTLPVSNAALAGWPMLYGSAAMAILWLATRFLAVWPSGVTVPVFWPLLLGPALLAWTQALTWMPYPLRGLRVIVTILWLALIDAVLMLALHFRASELVMTALLAPHVPLAYLVALFAVGRARRGHVPDWRAVFARGRVADDRARPRGRFSSAARAQEWFEWRQHGRSLPCLVAILLPVELALLFVVPDTPAVVLEILGGVLLTPPFLAAFVAATVSRSNPAASGSHSVSPFLATRPLTDASLVAAKLKVALWSTFATWLLVLAAVPLASWLSGTSALVVDRARRLTEVAGTPRAVVLVLLVFSALVAWTWKRLVQSLYVGLSGRAWMVKASVFLPLSFLAAVLPLGSWILRDRVLMAALWNALPWIAAVLVTLKIAAAAWIAVRLHDTRLLGDGALVLGAACWCALVFALYGLLVWLVPTVIFWNHLLVLVAILLVPLTRLSAAPLALASSRHG